MSGSYDKTVRIWDSASGMSAYTPACVRGLPGLGLGFEGVYVATRACAALSYRGGVSGGVRVCVSVCVCVCARGRRWAWGAPTIAARYPLPPNPCAPTMSVPVPVPVPVPPRTPLRLPTVNTPLPQVNCAALCKAIHTTSWRSPSRPTGTTSCPDRVTTRSGSGTPHRVCLHIRRRAYVAFPVSVSVLRECTSPLGPAKRCRTVGACLSVGARARVCVSASLPQVNCAALWKAIQTRSGRSPSRPTGTTSCPHRMTTRSGSGTPHRVCLHIRRRAYVAFPMFDFLFGNGEGGSERAREPSARGAGGTVGGGRAVVPWGRVCRCARVRVCVFLRLCAGAEVGVGRASIQPSPNTTRSPPTPAPPRCLSPSLSLSLSPHAPPSACPPSTHLFHRSTAPHSARPFKPRHGGRHRAQRGLHRVRIA